MEMGTVMRIPSSELETNVKSYGGALKFACYHLQQLTAISTLDTIAFLILD